jgi:hypothetical protein
MKSVADRVRKLIADQFEVESVKDDAQIGWGSQRGLVRRGGDGDGG